MHAYEFKWNTKGKKNPPLTFAKAYPRSDYHVVNPENYENFIRNDEK